MRIVLQIAASLVAGVMLAWGVSSCGSGGEATGTVGTKAKEGVTAASSQVEGKRETTVAGTNEGSSPPKPASSPTKTVTDTKTVTEAKTVTQTVESKPPKPKTKTVTETVTAPAPPPANQTTVHATTDESDSLPWWGWLLIALALAGAALGMYFLGRSRGRREEQLKTASPPPIARDEGDLQDPPLSDSGVPDEPWPKPPGDRL